MALLTHPEEIDARTVSIGDIVLYSDIDSGYSSVRLPKEITKVFNIEDKMMIFHYDNGAEHLDFTFKCFAMPVDTKVTVIRKLVNVLGKL